MQGGMNLGRSWLIVALTRLESKRRALIIPGQRQRHCCEQPVKREINWLPSLKNCMRNVRSKEGKGNNPAWICALYLLRPRKIGNRLDGSGLEHFKPLVRANNRFDQRCIRIRLGALSGYDQSFLF